MISGSSKICEKLDKELECMHYAVILFKVQKKVPSDVESSTLTEILCTYYAFITVKHSCGGRG